MIIGSYWVHWIYAALPRTFASVPFAKEFWTWERMMSYN